MNNISWMIYWADVLPALSNALCGVAVCVLLAACAMVWVYFFYMEDANDTSPYRSQYYVDHARQIQRITRHGFWMTPIFLVLALSTSFVPSKETFYLIAGSEIAETATQTPEFGKVRKVLNGWLDQQIPKEVAKNVDTRP